MSFFHKKMSQNVWAIIMPFGPVTIIFYWPKKFFSGQPKAGPHFRHCVKQRVKQYILLNTSRKHVNYEDDKNKVPMNKPYHIQNTIFITWCSS